MANAAYSRRVDDTIRRATPDDFTLLGHIARLGDSEADPVYLDHIQRHGTLLVQETDGAVRAFAGMILVDGVAMVTDLFVDPSLRGTGVGSRLLDTLLTGHAQRMTFSSKHPAAVPAYRRAGMDPQWRLLYLRGTAVGGAPAFVEAPWGHDRVELVDYYVTRAGRHDADVVLVPEGDEIDIARLQGSNGPARFDAVLAALPAGTSVTCCAPEHGAVATHALARGFEVFDNDIFCAAPGITLPADLHCLNPGLV